MHSPQLTDQTFSDFVSGNPFAIVHCWAAWNGYDHTMRARLSGLKPEFPKIAFAEFDVDPPAHHAICLELKVLGPPFLALYCGGSLMETHVGMLERNDLRILLTRFPS